MREREREREYFESRNSNGHISVFHHWIELGFWIYYAPHHPLTSDRWDLKDLVFFLCERYNPYNISRKTYFRASHDRWRFPPPSIVGSYSMLDILVILMSTSF